MLVARLLGRYLAEVKKARWSFSDKTDGWQSDQAAGAVLARTETQPGCCCRCSNVCTKPSAPCRPSKSICLPVAESSAGSQVGHKTKCLLFPVVLVWCFGSERCDPGKTELLLAQHSRHAQPPGGCHPKVAPPCERIPSSGPWSDSPHMISV